MDTRTAAEVTFFGISCRRHTTDSRIRGAGKTPTNKKAEDCSSASFWLVPSPRHMAKTYCNGAMLVVQAPEPIAVLLTRITASANEQK